MRRVGKLPSQCKTNRNPGIDLAEQKADRKDETMEWLWVLFGSAAGGCARYELSRQLGLRLAADFPWGTLMVNLSGSFAIGFFLAWADIAATDTNGSGWNALVTIGFLGGYTTVSSFALQTLQLIQTSRLVAALGNSLMSLLGCIFAAAIGFFAGGALQ
ncbi:MAG: fluoride efflux transporter CrcB [Opitutales bacterium]|nr:fluoride efflux transporter CrcB [Opitutales bacterium]